MEEISFLKTYCPKLNRYWGVRLKKIGGEWVATDFYPMTNEEAKVVASQANQPRFDVKPTMTPCVDGGGHTMRSSDRIPCPRPGQYSFQCIYCKKLEIRYDSDLRGTQRREGDIIKLSQGQEIRIESNGRPLENVMLEVGWDPAKSGSNMDVDSTVFLLGNCEAEMIYFGKHNDDAYSIEHHGDNLTGRGDDVDETIDIRLNKVPSKYTKIPVVINIYSAHSRRQTLGTVKNMFIRLVDKNSRSVLCEYTVMHNLYNATGLTIGVLTRSGNGWTFRASGAGEDVENLYEYREILEHQFRSGKL